MNAKILPPRATPDPIGRTLVRLLRPAIQPAPGAPTRHASPRLAGGLGTPDCTTFIRIWIDADALHPDTTDGIHVADNHSHHGSRHQGTPALSTCVNAGSGICWEIFNISPTSDAMPRIHSISTSRLFAREAPPRPAPDNADAHTAIAIHPGQDIYTIAFGVTRPGRPPLHFRITPSLAVLEHGA